MITVKEIDYGRSHPEAVLRFKAREKLNATTNILNSSSYGYGDLDSNGFFQYELYFLETLGGEND